ncbi:MAG: hypothetical protein GY721_00970, partial [Deltaproteobacteria bacterium]|nr:hypothetical protein [Deltaproteobacteria bacterium]
MVFRLVVLHKLPKVAIEAVHIAAQGDTLLPVVAPIFVSAVLKTLRDSPECLNG